MWCRGDYSAATRVRRRAGVILSGRLCLVGLEPARWQYKYECWWYKGNCWGMTRDWVAGLTVVTGNGEILRLNKDLLKNNTGYDLRQLFIGGEGTLGFITEATMRLTRQPQNLTVLVLAIPELDDVMKVLHQFQ